MNRTCRSSHPRWPGLTGDPACGEPAEGGRLILIFLTKEVAS
ncbi:MAG TPA: hypothetical protein VMT31_00635 [Methanomicrobiales archaeon]|nr:hypothetical protein [Methanomicrobiales archaeon]